MKSNLGVYLGLTAVVASCGYLACSLFSKQKLQCAPDSQLAYKEEGILNLLHRDKNPKHIGKLRNNC